MIIKLKNICSKIIKTFQLVIKSKWKFSRPKLNKILIIDGVDDPFKFFFKKNKYEIIYRRGEEINIYVLFQCLRKLHYL